MGELIKLKAADGHEFDAYVAGTEKTPQAGLVVLQEAFGVNAHIRRVTDAYARDGFLAVAPALFDRYERGVELGYEGADREKAMSFAKGIDPGDAMKDVAATLEYLRAQKAGKCGVIGYCMGGSVAWLAATRLDANAAVGYYGGSISRFAHEKLRCPVMLHFGTLDKHIPKSAVDEVQKLHPNVQIFWYEVGHGFNSDDRGSYNPAAAKLARERSVEFLRKWLVVNG
ncbi:MAG TPA: dienelactone hydrolase family protein [Terriglobales bacterium]|nr:dienelactone hydrolase family protein [Terriglobales bacterium]